ncbi:hypothetical protein ISCGN_012110 [Ixodes scapularis]
MPFSPDTGKPRTAIRGRANPHGSGSVETPLSKHLLSQLEPKGAPPWRPVTSTAPPVSEIHQGQRDQVPDLVMTETEKQGVQNPVQGTQTPVLGWIPTDQHPPCHFGVEQSALLQSQDTCLQEAGAKVVYCLTRGSRRVQTYPKLDSTTKMPFPPDTGKPRTARCVRAKTHGSGSVETQTPVFTVFEAGLRPHVRRLPVSRRRPIPEVKNPGVQWRYPLRGGEPGVTQKTGTFSAAANPAEDWSDWKKSFTIYERATKYHKEDDETRIALLLHVGGAELVQKYHAFTFPAAQQKFADVLQRFDEHFESHDSARHSDKCYNCGKPNHYAALCQQQHQPRPLQSRHAHVMRELQEDAPLSLDMLTVRTVQHSSSWSQRVNVSGHDIVFKLDTGSDVNLISTEQFQKLPDPPPLNSPGACVTTYTVVCDYNWHMGGLDMCDQMMECYCRWIKTRKWTLKVILYFMDFAIVNAWMEY